MISLPCKFPEVRFPCDECNRHFRSRTYFANHKQIAAKIKSVCERKRCCATCGLIMTGDSHDCNKPFCANCKPNRHVGHVCCMRPIKDVLPSTGDKVLHVFYDFETTQNMRYSDKATLHVPELGCLLQFCSQGEDVENTGNCVRCGKRKHLFWGETVGNMLTYLREPSPWANKIVAIAHNAKVFDQHFIQNRAIMWVKLTDRKYRTQTKVISEPNEPYRFLATIGIEVTNLTFTRGDVVRVSWKHAAEKHIPNFHHTN